MHSHLLRCSRASSCFSLGGPAKVKTGKSFLFTEGSLKVENKERLFDFIYIYVTNGWKGRTSSVPISARHLKGDKVQGLRSGLYFNTPLLHFFSD